MEAAGLFLGAASLAGSAGNFSVTVGQLEWHKRKGQTRSISKIDYSTEAIGLLELYRGKDHDVEYEFFLSEWPGRSALMQSDSIVFVHSLVGDPLGTWATGPKRWPEHFLPHAFPNARILAFGYTGLLTPSSKPSIEALGQLLCSALFLDEQSVTASSRPMVFIAHGIGGLIVKSVWRPLLEYRLFARFSHAY